MFVLVKTEPMKEKNNSNTSDLNLYQKIFQNVTFCMFLINTKVEVVLTNYYDLYPYIPKSDKLILGNVLRCKNACDSGTCGDSKYCASCMIRASITQSFASGNSFHNVESHMRILNKRNEAMEVDVEVEGKVVKIDDNEYLVLSVHDNTTTKAIQRRFIENEYRLKQAIRETDLYLKLIHGITSSLDGKLSAMKALSEEKSVSDDYSSKIIKQYMTPTISALPKLLVLSNSQDNIDELKDFLGKIYNLRVVRTLDEGLMAFLNGENDAVIIAADISMNEANMFSDVIHCSAGQHPVLRIVNPKESAAGTYDEVIVKPYSQKLLVNVLSRFDV